MLRRAIGLHMVAAMLATTAAAANPLSGKALYDDAFYFGTLKWP
jgi:hypothetical protein